jgi:uncharacterized membrane protein YqiK
MTFLLLIVVGSALVHIACSVVVLLLVILTVLCSRTSVAVNPEQALLRLRKYGGAADVLLLELTVGCRVVHSSSSCYVFS